MVATIHGSIHLLDPQFAIAESWIAHVNGRVTHMAERKGILITLGVSFILFPFLGDEDANSFSFLVSGGRQCALAVVKSVEFGSVR